MNAFRFTLRLAAFVAVAAPPLSAQGAGQPACEIKLDKLPRQAQTGYAMLELKGASDAQKRSVREGLKSVTEKNAKLDPAAANFYVGRALLWFAEQPNAAATAKRGDLGFADAPDATVDLYAAMDTAFRAVETSAPACASETERYRRYVWGKMLNAAVPFINTKATDSAGVKRDMDSAVVLLNIANAAFPNQPHGYFYLSYAAQRRGDAAAAVEALKRAVALSTPELMAQDSTVKAVRRDALLNLGVAQQTMADKAQGDQKKAMSLDAAKTFRTYLGEFPNTEDAPKVQNALTRSLTIGGDTTALAQTRADMLNNPSKYNDHQLIEAGAAAFKTGNREQAAKYFEGALTVNPNNRDALFNLMNMYSTLKQYDKVIEVGRRLVTVDPNYPDTWHIIGYAYQETAKKTTDAKAKKAQLDSAQAYAAKEKKLPAKVQFTLFDHDGAKHTIRGTVENLTKAAKRWTMRFEFLDSKGSVVATKEAPVSVTAGGKTPFTVEVQQEGVVAFRYAPLT